MNNRHRKTNQTVPNGQCASTNGKVSSAKFNGKSSAKLVANNSACDSKINDWFRLFAHKSSEIVGCAGSFALALFVLIAWAVSGPLFGFSDTWQLIINTATTIVTFLMVFLIQNTQNRDAKAIHLKLDELIHSLKGARNRLINLEDLSDEELNKIRDSFKRIAEAGGKSQKGNDPN